MTARRRTELLALPDGEAAVVAHHSRAPQPRCRRSRIDRHRGIAPHSYAHADMVYERGDVCAALACLTDAIHAQPLSSWFGTGHRASADGQAFYLGGPGEAGGTVNALDGIHGHEAQVDATTLHVDGGGVSDIVFAVMHLLGLDLKPRIPRLSDRRLYAFEPARRYGRLGPLFGQRLDRERIVPYWPEIAQVICAISERTVTPSLILRKLSAYRQQNGLAAAFREVGRIERKLFTLRWFEDAALRRTVTAELNKGEARNSLARAVAFHRRYHPVQLPLSRSRR